MTIQSSTVPYLKKYMTGSNGVKYYTIRNFQEQGLMNERKNPYDNRIYAFKFPTPVFYKNYV
jgi:hypothetical protein